MMENIDVAGEPDGGPETRDPVHPGQYLPLSASADRGSAATAGPARELLATVSDRIRNPLQVLLARADLMEDEETAGRIREQVRRINDAVKYLEDVLPDSYSTSRIHEPALYEKTYRR